GVYDANRPFYVTNSPSMDILVSGNLERMLYHLSGEDAGEVAALMAALEKDGRYEVGARIREGLGDFYGGFCGEDETLAAIGALYARENYLMDTHTAVAYRVYEDYLRETGDKTPTVIVSTASAYKFAPGVAGAIGLEAGADAFADIAALHEKTGVRVPDALKNLANKEIRHNAVVAVGEMAKAVRDSLPA
ncbi:MAG: threonine synthase, partial [Clostridiales Family XIII bacterium]|nr:threonine synthase [Clostridiales Family XIII bacterium]